MSKLKAFDHEQRVRLSQTGALSQSHYFPPKGNEKIKFQ
jgi:hypothetical protein